MSRNTVLVTDAIVNDERVVALSKFGEVTDRGDGSYRITHAELIEDRFVRIPLENVLGILSSLDSGYKQVLAAEQERRLVAKQREYAYA